jgi:exonuclease SbcD
MRLLHTSDWHVGRTIRGRGRLGEHAAVLAEVVGLAAAHEVDLVVVAGDLFETAAPSPEAEALVWRTLLELAGTGAEVVVVAGNHDNGRRLHGLGPLFALGRVHLLGEPAAPGAGGVHLAAGRHGGHLRVAALPFVSQRGIVKADQLMATEAFEHAQAYEERMAAVLAALCAGFTADVANVVVAHAFVRGGAPGGGERVAHLVEDYGVGAGVFPASAAYVALGHLHRAQRLPGATAVHYCGSPLQLDFGEEEHRKQVNLVEVEPGLPARVTPLPLTAGRPLRTRTGTLEELRAAGAGDPDDPWLRVRVREAPRPGLADDVRALLGDRVVEVRVDDPDRGAAEPRPVSRRGRAPQELFAEFLAERGLADARLGVLFAELLEQAGEAG